MRPELDNGLRSEFAEFAREGHSLPDSPALIALTIELYRQLGQGDPVERSTLAHKLKEPVSTIDRRLAELPKSTIEYDRAGDVVAFGGLSVVPANHTFTVDGRELYTWCVFDALFLPGILGKSATLATQCPVRGHTIEIALSKDSITSCRPSDPVMSIVVPDRAACSENLRGAFCNHVNFFADETAYDEWAADNSDVSFLSVDKAHELAKQRNEHRYGAQLRAA